MSKNIIANDKDENALIEEVKRGDDTAFRILMLRYMKPVSNFIYQYCKDKEEIEDIVGDTFFKIWKNIRHFHKEKNFKPWLFTIARNTALDYLKKKKSLPFSSFENDEDGDDFSQSIGDEEPLPPQIFAKKELEKELANVLEKINPESKAILHMHYQEEMTFEEIALITKRPMNTIKSMHQRAIMKIRKELSGYIHP